MTYCSSVAPNGSACTKRFGHGAFIENANHSDGDREWVGGSVGKGTRARWADGSLEPGESPCEATAPDGDGLRPACA